MTLITITGGSGFVGSSLVNYLSSYDCHIDFLSLRELAPLKLRRDTYAVIHLAGKAHDLEKVSHPSEYYTVNFELTKQLYDLFLHSEAKKFIFISSVKASADFVEGVLTERDVPSPKTDYGKSKLMAEEYIQRQLLPQGKSFYILRPCMIHGPGNKGNLNLLYSFISKGVPYPLAAFENKRSFLSVENLSFVIHQIVNRNDIASGVYNVADDETLSTNELIRLMAEVSDRKPFLWRINPTLINTLAKVGDCLKFPLTSERLKKLTANYIVDNTKIKEALGMNLPVQARDGLIKTIGSFKVRTKQ